MTPTFYKVLTHDLCPPLRGGDPLLDGELPFTTPKVHLDLSGNECGRDGGWHFTDNLATAFRIAGLWPNGCPARAFEIEPADDAIQRGNKWRASSVTFTRELDLGDIEAGIYDLSRSLNFSRRAKVMTKEQLAWYVALGRPEHDPDRVEEGLRKALKTRGLAWDLRRFDLAWAARDAWDAWAARDAWDAWDARAAWAARDAWDAWAARDAWDAWDAWDARAAWDAWAALMISYLARCGWIDYKPDLLTTGIRDGYHHGLAVAIPTGPDELGWAMEESNS